MRGLSGSIRVTRAPGHGSSAGHERTARFTSSMIARARDAAVEVFKVGSEQCRLHRRCKRDSLVDSCGLTESMLMTLCVAICIANAPSARHQCGQSKWNGSGSVHRSSSTCGNVSTSSASCLVPISAPGMSGSPEKTCSEYGEVQLPGGCSFCP